MIPGFTDLPTPGPVSVALFVLAATGTFVWLVATGRVEFRSLYTVELSLMLLFITWVGVLRPVRA